jgi:AraC-like DNA-binding protein
MPSSQPERFYSIPSATGAIARLACARLRELGKDAAAVLATVKARPEQVYDDTIRLEVPKQIRILELASEELQDGLLGFHLARNFDLREVGLVYYVIASSERFADALLDAKRYCTIMNEGVRLQMRQDDRTVSIALDYVDIDRKSDRHQIEFWLVTMVRICRKVTDTRLALRHLRIRHRRDETPAEFKSFFGCDVEFGADCDEIIFPAPVASLPIVGRDNYLNDLLRQYAEAALAGHPNGRGALRSAVEGVLPQLLPHARASISNVAKQLAMSSRTLSRKLRDEGVAFTEILEESRGVLAKSYLAERDLPVSEIAWLLGYREVSAFTNAFKRWTGMTPRQFRLAAVSLQPTNTLKGESAG